MLQEAVSPGVVDTEWCSAMPDDDRAAFLANAAATTPSRQVASAAQIAKTILLVATNRAIDGLILVADGGLRLVGV